MRLNNFGLNKEDKWKRVEDELYLTWRMNQSDTVLPRFLDTDFKRCFDNIKKQYTYKQICKELKL